MKWSQGHDYTCLDDGPTLILKLGGSFPLLTNRRRFEKFGADSHIRYEGIEDA